MTKNKSPKKKKQGLIRKAVREAGFPKELAKPAQRALKEVGYLALDELIKLSEAELVALQNLSKKVLEQIRKDIKAKIKNNAKK